MKPYRQPTMSGLVNTRGRGSKFQNRQHRFASTVKRSHGWNNGRRSTTGPGFLQGGASKRQHHPATMVDNGKRTRVVMTSGIFGNHAKMERWNPGR